MCEVWHQKKLFKLMQDFKTYYSKGYSYIVEWRKSLNGSLSICIGTYKAICFHLPECFSCKQKQSQLQHAFKLYWKQSHKLGILKKFVMILTESSQPFIFMGFPLKVLI